MQQLVIRHDDGHAYPLYVGEDENYYVYDPFGTFPGKHGPLPGATTETIIDAATKHGGLAGLGASMPGRAAEAVVPAALSFVPYVGPILAAVASIAGPIVGGMFGGDDPTPMSVLQSKAVSLRQAIVNAHLAMGIPDAMPSLPSGKTYSKSFPDLAVILEMFPNLADTSDPAHWRCGKDPGVSCPHCGGVRVCTYDVIARLTPIAQQLSQQAHDYTLTHQILGTAATLSPAGSVTSPAPGGIYNVSDPNAPIAAGTQADIMGMGQALTYLPLLLGGAALLFTMREKSLGGGRTPRRGYASRRK